MDIRRGAIVAARLDPIKGSEQGGTRPVLVVSNDMFNEALPILTVVPLTRRHPGRRTYPSEVAIARGTAGLRADSIILCHQIRTIDRSRVGRVVGIVDEPVLAEVEAALAVHLDLTVR